LQIIWKDKITSRHPYGQVVSINRESLVIRGLTALPFSKSDLYRVDFAVTTVGQAVVSGSRRVLDIRNRNEPHENFRILAPIDEENLKW
jgi:hypothetical protein